MSEEILDALRRAQEAADLARAELRLALRTADPVQSLLILQLIGKAATLEADTGALIGAMQ